MKPKIVPFKFTKKQIEEINETGKYEQNIFTSNKKEKIKEEDNGNNNSFIDQYIIENKIIAKPYNSWYT